MTQLACAAACGISPRQMTRIVSGEDVPSLDLAFKLRKVLNTSFDALFVVSPKYRVAP